MTGVESAFKIIKEASVAPLPLASFLLIYCLFMYDGVKMGDFVAEFVERILTGQVTGEWR